MSAQVTVVVAGETHVRSIDDTTTWADVLGDLCRGCAASPSPGWTASSSTSTSRPGPVAMVEPVMVTDPDGLRGPAPLDARTCMAQAVQDVFPEAKLGIGPPIENGFYYDFDVAEPFTPRTSPRVEKRMEEIVKSGQRFVAPGRDRGRGARRARRRAVQAATHRQRGRAPDVMEVGGTRADHLRQRRPRSGERVWGDLCRGPHVPTTRLIAPNAFKLMRSSAAYWRGNENNAQLQRIYGTAWPNKDELHGLPDASSRRPRSATTAASAPSSTCSASPTRSAPGWRCSIPRAASSAATMEDYSRRRHEEAGYEFVYTPHITKGARCSRSPGTSTGTPTACTRPMQLDEERDAEGTIRGRAPTTTSSR